MLYDAENAYDLALASHNKAVAYEPIPNIALKNRAEFFLKRDQYKEAIIDFEAVLDHSPNDFRAHKGIAAAAVMLEDLDKVLRHIDACVHIDKAQTELLIVPISRPFWDNPNTYELGIQYYQKMLDYFPDREWLKININRLKTRLSNEGSWMQN